VYVNDVSYFIPDNTFKNVCTKLNLGLIMSGTVWKSKGQLRGRILNDSEAKVIDVNHQLRCTVTRELHFPFFGSLSQKSPQSET
jgi:hypothetical protein